MTELAAGATSAAGAPSGTPRVDQGAASGSAGTIAAAAPAAAAGTTPAAAAPASGAAVAPAGGATSAAPSGEGNKEGAAAAAGAPVANGDPGADAGAGAAWGANWRESYAGTDEAKLNVLKRYADPRAALDAFFSSKSKIDAGQVKAPLPENPTPEQLTAFRKENGIPETTDGYFTSMPKEMQNDATKDLLADFGNSLQELNLTPAQATKLLQANQQRMARQIEQRTTEDTKLKDSTLGNLRDEWGNDFRPNLNNVQAMLDNAPETVRTALLSARIQDGSRFIDTKPGMQWMAQLARTINPFGTLVGTDGSALDTKGADQRISEIKGWMGAPKGSVEYRKYYDDSKIQAEYRTLLEAQERMKPRSAAA